MAPPITYCPNHSDRKAGPRSGLCTGCYRKRWQASRVNGPKCTKHPDRAAKARNMCDSCYQKAWKIKTYGVSTDPGNTRRSRAGYRRRKRDDPDYVRRSYYRFQYGLSLEQVEQMISAQEGRCAICHAPPIGGAHGGKLNVDHDPDSQAIRGMLCNQCNQAIGLLRHDVDRLRSAIEYLQSSNTGLVSRTRVRRGTQSGAAVISM